MPVVVDIESSPSASTVSWSSTVAATEGSTAALRKESPRSPRLVMSMYTAPAVATAGDVRAQTSEISISEAGAAVVVVSAVESSSLPQAASSATTATTAPMARRRDERVGRLIFMWGDPFSGGR